MDKYVLAIDRGCTNTKAVIFDSMGNEVAVYRKINQKPLFDENGSAEVDMQVMIEEVYDVIKKATSNLSTSAQIQGVGVVGQGSGLYIVDKDTKPLRKGILSLDTRMEQQVEKIRARGIAQKYKEDTVATLMPDKPLVLLRWIKQMEPDIYSKIDKILFSKDWINLNLCGKAYTDITDASSAGLLRKSDLSLYKEGFTMLGVDEMVGKIPQIMSSHTKIGTITKIAAQKTGLLEGTPVVCGAHDLQTFPYGTGTLSPHSIVSIMGTWGTNTLPAKKEKNVNTSGFEHIVPGYEVYAKFDGSSGAVLDNMRELMYPEISYVDIEKMLIDVPRTSVCFVPHIFGKPQNEHANARFSGLRTHHGRADIIRAVYEGVAFAHYENIQNIMGYENAREIWLVGGGSKSDGICRIFADITGFTLHTSSVEEITARGMALNTLVGIGVYKSHEDACIKAPISKTFEPIPSNKSYYEEKYLMYKKLCSFE